MKNIKIILTLIIFLVSIINVQAQDNIDEKNWDDTVSWISHHLDDAEHVIPKGYRSNLYGRIYISGNLIYSQVTSSVDNREFLMKIPLDKISYAYSDRNTDGKFLKVLLTEKVFEKHFRGSGYTKSFRIRMKNNEAHSKLLKLFDHLGNLNKS